MYRETFTTRALSRILSDDKLFTKISQRLFLCRLAETTDNINMLTILSGYRHEEDGANVRGAVARNEHTPECILVYLSDDPDSYVRAGVAENLSTPVDILEKLTRDRHWFVRSSTRGNPKITSAMLKYMRDNGLWTKI